MYCVIFMQSTTFNIVIMATILLSSITIAMETTDLAETMPDFFIAIDLVYLVVFFVEFLLKVSKYQWKNTYRHFHATDMPGTSGG